MNEKRIASKELISSLEVYRLKSGLIPMRNETDTQFIEQLLTIEPVCDRKTFMSQQLSLPELMMKSSLIPDDHPQKKAIQSMQRILKNLKPSNILPSNKNMIVALRSLGLLPMSPSTALEELSRFLPEILADAILSERLKNSSSPFIKQLFEPVFSEEPCLSKGLASVIVEFGWTSVHESLDKLMIALWQRFSSTAQTRVLTENLIDIFSHIDSVLSKKLQADDSEKRNILLGQTPIERAKRGLTSAELHVTDSEGNTVLHHLTALLVIRSDELGYSNGDTLYIFAKKQIENTKKLPSELLQNELKNKELIAQFPDGPALISRGKVWSSIRTCIEAGMDLDETNNFGQTALCRILCHEDRKNEPGLDQFALKSAITDEQWKQQLGTPTQTRSNSKVFRKMDFRQSETFSEKKARLLACLAMLDPFNKEDDALFEVLLYKGLDGNWITNNGHQLIFDLAENLSVRWLKLLKLHEHSLDIKREDGKTPLHVLVESLLRLNSEDTLVWDNDKVVVIEGLTIELPSSRGTSHFLELKQRTKELIMASLEDPQRMALLKKAATELYTNRDLIVELLVELKNLGVNLAIADNNRKTVLSLLSEAGIESGRSEEERLAEDWAVAAAGSSSEMSPEERLAAEWASLAVQSDEGRLAGGGTRVLNQDEIDSLLGFNED